MQPSELKGRINETINEQLDACGAAQLSWIILKLVLECEFPNEDHEEQSMRLIAVREGFRHIVGSVNRGCKADVDEQTVLPGFDRLQRAYSIVRRKKEWIVRIDELSLGELLAKRSQLIKMMHGIGTHVHEIDRYIRVRWPSAA